MRALVEGSEWMGQWTEFTVEALRGLGFSVDVIYSNRKDWRLRLRSLAGKLGITDFKKDLEGYYAAEILSALTQRHYDFYVSVSGKLNSGLLQSIRRQDSKTRIVYWIGDRFSGHIKDKFDDLYGSIALLDGIAFAEPGVHQRLVAEGHSKIYYLPFGFSNGFHRHLPLRERDRQRFSCDVAFVGTHNAQREEMMRYLNARLPRPVALWGRSWQGTGIPCRGRLSLQETNKVYACAKISLNTHQPGVGGGNMRYFEIPAVGGFQLCDRKPHLPREEFGDRVATFGDYSELVEKIMYYLEHEAERRAAAAELQELCLRSCSYQQRFERLFEQMT